MPYDPPPELAGLSLARIAALAAARKVPPVDQWKPDRTGESEMRIAADGRWFHHGGEITRPAMIRAFSALLICDKAGQHWLVTPQERLAIAVEDAAFIAIDVVAKGADLAFRLNTGDTIIAGPQHPIRATGEPDTPALYLAVRHGVEARLNRSTYGQIVEFALNNSHMTVSSMGHVYSLVPA